MITGNKKKTRSYSECKRKKDEYFWTIKYTIQINSIHIGHKNNTIDVRTSLFVQWRFYMLYIRYFNCI